MAVDLIATPGAVDANAFADVAYGTAYLNTRLNAGAWTDADDDDQARALIEATRELTLYEYRGVRASATQALAWPRYEAENLDDPDGGYFDDDVIPAKLQDATVELALEFLRAGTTDLSKPSANRDVIRKKVDVLETEWAKPQDRLYGIELFPRVLAMIAPLLAARAGVMELVRT